MEIYGSKQFGKQYQKFSRPVRAKVDERLQIFTANPFHPVLENHRLHGAYKGCRSIRITGDLRAIYHEVSPKAVRFLAIGTHHELYGI